MDKKKLYERYQRQIILPEFGEEGQQKLLQAKVLVIGAGGLGCPVLQYLAAAGIGTIGIVDDDEVALNNLHRQVLYSVNDIGLSKSERAAQILGQLNPGIQIIPYSERLTVQNALILFEEFDIIICATGFNVSFRPFWKMIGRNGVDLNTEWAVLPEAYFGICAPDHPNYFVFNGPNSPGMCKMLCNVTPKI